LVKAETFVAGKLTATGQYSYDSLGRRVAKRAEIDGQVELKRFFWQDLRMLCEHTPEVNRLYLYESKSHTPLARVDQQEGGEQRVYYFHTDQAGLPFELTSASGEIVWQAMYRGWGEVEKLVFEHVEQNIRFQGQYYDCETKLCYSAFRYYDAGAGRFITQDPIGLSGGINLYRYAPNGITWVDPLGLAYKSVNFEGSPALFPVSGNQKNIVEIQLQGSRTRDFTEAFKQAGLKKSQVKAVGKYTWHHLDDFDPVTGKSTMQLVEHSAHSASLPHTGSASQFEKHFGLRSGAYDTAEAIAISQEKGWLKGRPLKTSSTSC
jgi:RHS repeat-associated protein